MPTSRPDDRAAPSTPEDVRARIDAGRVWLWENAAGEVVHLTGASLPSFGVSRIGPVYTPREHRGRGYASSTVAAVTARLLAQAERVCLFTDQANPISNRIYEALGFEPVTDMANLLIRRDVTTPAPV
ncbi:GNAT family N-acetyltransferase [Nocardioides sp.]|uniref:GNAT family N-acetyltransferase n=1 Tax=Nocardioides sp. TaxID=35761 RepID=UPI003569CDDA